MPWKEGYIELPKKKSGDKFEASYINNALALEAKFLNSLVDAFKTFETSTQHRVNGLAYTVGEDSDQERYAINLSGSTFKATLTGEPDTENGYSIVAIDFKNEGLPYNDGRPEETDPDTNIIYYPDTMTGNIYFLKKEVGGMIDTILNDTDFMQGLLADLATMLEEFTSDTAKSLFLNYVESQTFDELAGVGDL